MNYTYEYIRKINGIALKKFEDVTKSYWKAHINCANIYNEKVADRNIKNNATKKVTFVYL